MILLYTQNITNRHNYVFEHIFGYLGIEYKLTSDPEYFKAWEDRKISYHILPIHNEVNFYAHGLLEQDGIKQIIPETGKHNGIITLFTHNSESSPLPYDIFSAVFYMLSRYEEYGSYTPDRHGRFEADQSLAKKEGFLYTPVVDLWIKQFAEVLKNSFPDLQFKTHDFKFIATYDIDIAWSYLHKGFFRNISGLIKDVLLLRINKYFERWSVLFKFKPDPFDSYDYLFELQDRYGLDTIFFIHPGTYGKYDKNISLRNKYVQRLIKDIQKKTQIGIHPSYLSTNNTTLLNREIESFESVVRNKITMARQHFIKLTLPYTYRNYTKNGITDDYSMGYATDIGFRAGTSLPFIFFDLLENKTLNLTIHPFIIMDGVFSTYKKGLSTEEILFRIKEIINSVKQTNGTLISIWHNESLGTSKEWQGWRELNEEIIKLAIKN